VLEPLRIVKGLAGVNVTIPVEEEDRITVRFASVVLGFPKGSCRCTVIFPDATPAVVVTTALVITNWLAAAATILKLPLVALVKPLAEAVKFKLFPAWRMTKSLNVALPLASVFWGTVPLYNVLPFSVRVIGLPLNETLLPAWSLICTTILAMVVPAVVFAGWIVKTNWLPTVSVAAEEVAVGEHVPLTTHRYLLLLSPATVAAVV
jgi:hypothetical protein